MFQFLLGIGCQKKNLFLYIVTILMKLLRQGKCICFHQVLTRVLTLNIQEKKVLKILLKVK